MVEEVIAKELERRTYNDAFTEINWEKTAELEKEEKYVNFNKWADENGIVRSAVRYPVAFGEAGLVGMSANRDIGINEAYLYVPSKCIICESRFRESEIGHLLDKHKQFF